MEKRFPKAVLALISDARSLSRAASGLRCLPFFAGVSMRWLQASDSSEGAFANPSLAQVLFVSMGFPTGSKGAFLLADQSSVCSAVGGLARA